MRIQRWSPPLSLSEHLRFQDFETILDLLVLWIILGEILALTILGKGINFVTNSGDRFGGSFNIFLVRLDLLLQSSEPRLKSAGFILVIVLHHEFNILSCNNRMVFKF